MTKLHSLSRDVLRLILDPLEITDLLQLYCSADPALKVALERSVPTSIVLDTHVRFMYGRLPAMVFNVAQSIVRFELCTVSRLAEFPQATQRAIRELSSELHTLRLETPEAEQILLTNDPTEFEALRLSYLTSAQGLPLPRGPTMLDLSKLFPRLHTLSIVPEGSLSIFESVDYCVLRNLPLITLQIFNSKSLDDNIIHHLPASLKSLGLGPEVHFDASAALLPPELEVFEWRLGGFDKPTREQLERFPQSLTVFKTTNHVASRFNADLLQYLPNKLQRFGEVGVFEPSPTTKMPNDLKELRMRVTAQVGPFIHTLLPPTLTSLFMHLPGADDRDFDFKAILPPTLLRFVVLARRNNPRGLVGPLPPNLTDLSHGTGQSLEGKWPESLRLLNVSGPARHQKLPLELPGQLEEVRAAYFDEDDLQELPSSLLALHSSSYMCLFDNILPRALTSLVAGELKISSKSINNLPRSLKILEIHKIQVRDALPDWNHCDWPPSLCKFTLTEASFDLTSAVVSNLPKSLEVLKMNACMLPADLLSALPRGLNELRLRTVSGDFDAHVADLPAGLTALRIDEGALTAESAAHWPRKLRDVSLYGFVPEPSLAHLLPLTLETTSLGENGLGLANIFTYDGPYDPNTRKLIDPTALATPEPTISRKPSKRDKCVVS